MSAAGGAPAYRHTQSGAPLAAGLALFGLAAFVPVSFSMRRVGGAPGLDWALLAGGLSLVLGGAAVFSSMTVEVDRDTLRWHFAFGRLRRTVPRGDIARVERTETSLLDGIGIHLGPRGWVYNVALGPAVRVVRRDGRAFVLGTDDPAGLVTALTPRA